MTDLSDRVRESILICGRRVSANDGATLTETNHASADAIADWPERGAIEAAACLTFRSLGDGLTTARTLRGNDRNRTFRIDRDRSHTSGLWHMTLEPTELGIAAAADK